MTLTRAVIDYIRSTRLDRFAVDAVEAGKRALVDGIGVMLAGSAARGSAILRDYVRGAGGRPEATILGRDRLAAPAALAALANAASGHADDYDDTQLSDAPDRIFGLLTHPTVPALAAALAIAERRRASGARLLEAYLTGVEVECKIADAIDPRHYVRGFHSSGTAGTFGALTAAAKLLDLDEAALGHAFGIASGLCSGIRVNFGTMTKPLHVGRAAENGVLAAELASRGFTGGADALDGPWGFFQVFGGGVDADRLASRLGDPHAFVHPGVSIKPYPCGSLAHPSMDALHALVVRHDVPPERVRAIRLRAGSNILNPLRYRRATTELQAKFCPAFMLASIALRRRAGIREFSEDFIASEPVQRMMDKVETVLDPAIDAKGFDRMRSIVEVQLDDGTWLQEEAGPYRGGPERPFTDEELRAKFTECAGMAMPGDRIDRALGMLATIERLDDVSQIVETLA